LLVTVTSRKALHLRRDEQRPKRGGGEVVHVADLSGASAGGNAIWEQVLDREPTPAYAALLAEEWRRLLERLEDEQLRTIAQYKLEGHTNQEIAGKLGYERVTVQRKLRLIRQLWAEEAAP
jgi:DNA-directed RNA polymerase specialized sigma24 family protein